MKEIVELAVVYPLPNITLLVANEWLHKLSRIQEGHSPMR
jgi:hypothetical protein